MEYKKAPRLNSGSIRVPLYRVDWVDPVNHIATKCEPALKAAKEKDSENGKAMDGRIHHCRLRKQVRIIMVSHG